MRFYSGKIRIKANSQLDSILKQLDESEKHQPLSSPATNPFHDLEDAHDKAFSSVAPHKVERIHGSQGSLPHFHYDAMGNKLAVAKPVSGDAMRESLAYQLSKHYAPGLIPRTVVRNHASPMGADRGRPTLHSVQQYVKPAQEQHHELVDPEIVNHPDYHKMAIMDWLHGNVDRHYHNIIKSEDGRLHAIDNGHSFQTPVEHGQTDEAGNAFNQHKGIWPHYNLSNIAYKGSFPQIPPDMRQSILQADPQKLGSLFDKVQHGMYVPNGAKEQYLHRLQTLKNHFANPEVENMYDLHDKLYDDIHPWASENYDPAAEWEKEQAFGFPGASGAPGRY